MNRFCRLAPIYWLVNLIMLAAENDYYDDDIYEKNCGLYILMTFSCTNTWFFYPWGQPYYVNPISIVGWTVNTLFFFYLTFPTLLKLLKPLSDKSISRLIVRLCLFQSIPFYLVWEFYSADPVKVMKESECNSKIEGVSKDRYWGPDHRLYLLLFNLTPLTPVIPN